MLVNPFSSPSITYISEPAINMIDATTPMNTTIFRTLARIGYVVQGIVHIVIGAIAISVAQGAGGEADQGGAMQQVASWPFGGFLLWVIAIGLFALGLWQVVEAFLVQQTDTKRKWGYRAKYVGTAVAYIAIAVTALTYALGVLAFSLPGSVIVVSVVVTTVVAIAVSVPSAPGYIGAFQLGCVLGLAIFGIQESEAIAYSIVLHLTQFVGVVVAGLYSLWSQNMTLRDIESVEDRNGAAA